MVDCEKRFIKNLEGEEIAAVIHYPNKSPKCSVLLQHGLFSNKDGEWERRANVFAEKGFKAVRFDRRGYGESDRDFREFNLSTGIKDSITLLDHFQERGDENFAIYGSSFGGLIGIHAAVEDLRIDAMGLRAPVTFHEPIFAALKERVKEKGSIDLEEEMPGAKIDTNFFSDLEKYGAEKAAKKITIPTIMFHGKKDEVVSLKESKRFYEKLKVKKEFHELENEGHIFSLSKDQEILKKSASWFSKVI